MRKGCRYLALAVLLAALSACTDGKSSRVITVAGDRSFEPYEFCAPYSKYASGILVEIWRLMAKRNNIRIRYGCYDWAVAQAAVSSGHADAIGGMVRSPRREELFHFVRRLVRNPPEYFYFDTNDYASEPDFAAIVNKGTPIGVVDGDYVVEELLATFPGINLRKYKSYFDVVEAADQNQIDFFAMEEFVASTHLNRLGIIQRFSRSANPLFHEWLWAAVRKDNIALATELELYFSKVRDDEMTTIERKWTTTSHGALALLLAPVEQWLEDHPEVFSSHRSSCPIMPRSSCCTSSGLLRSTVFRGSCGQSTSPRRSPGSTRSRYGICCSLFSPTPRATSSTPSSRPIIAPSSRIFPPAAR